MNIDVHQCTSKTSFPIPCFSNIQFVLNNDNSLRLCCSIRCPGIFTLKRSTLVIQSHKHLEGNQLIQELGGHQGSKEIPGGEKRRKT